jgi:hypothetical protein
VKSTKGENLIEQAKERLLDPFEPVFPMPGMWHLAFGFIFSLVSFVGGLTLVMGYASFLHPTHEVAAAASASLLSALLVIFSTRGINWAVTLMKLLALSPIVAVIFKLYFQQSVGTFLSILIALGIASFLLLNSTTLKALINILAVRRYKIIQMKKDGMYTAKLQAAKRRWRL